nr:hypothetical protein [Nocardia cyriacigeorgica]
MLQLTGLRGLIPGFNTSPPLRLLKAPSPVTPRKSMAAALNAAAAAALTSSRAAGFACVPGAACISAASKAV